MTSNFYVLLSDVPFTSQDLATTLAQPGVSNYYVSGYSGVPGTIKVNRTARYVRLQFNGAQYLVLGEVQIWSAIPGVQRQNVSWTGVVGASLSGNSLSKPGAAGWNAGAVSGQTIGSGDGYMEFTATETTTHRRAGLSNGDSSQSWDDIDYCVYLQANGTIDINEGPNPRGSFGTYATGDLFRVTVEGGVVKYYKNGALMYTSTIAPTYPLLVDTSLYSTNSTLTNVVLSGNIRGELKYVFQDVQGSTRAIMSGNQIAARHDYLPSGEEIGAGVGLRTIGLGYGNIDRVRQRYGSTERDDSSGLDHTWWRKYENLAGRWTSPDPYRGSITTADPQSLNLYAYTENDPVNHVDPSGLLIAWVCGIGISPWTGDRAEICGFYHAWSPFPGFPQDREPRNLREPQGPEKYDPKKIFDEIRKKRETRKQAWQEYQDCIHNSAGYEKYRSGLQGVPLMSSPLPSLTITGHNVMFRHFVLGAAIASRANVISLTGSVLLWGVTGTAEHDAIEKQLYNEFLAPVEQECRKNVQQKYGFVPNWHDAS